VRTVTKDTFTAGIRLLSRPVMPLVSMLQFLYLTGPFATVAEVIDELPEPIETGRTRYEQPRAQLKSYLAILAGLEPLKRGVYQAGRAVVDEGGSPVDKLTAGTALIQQEVLAAELEGINSLLCSPCGCTLCCVGPDRDMAQEFFEIPLAAGELDLFPVARHDSAETRGRRSTDEEELQLDGLPFYRLPAPALIHWQNGWRLNLPKETVCPNLEQGTGRCRVYTQRPVVCRRPQIFPYMVEPLETATDGQQSYRIRQALLAITDCPYVGALRDEIAEYAAASELNLIFNRNKA